MPPPSASRQRAPTRSSARLGVRRPARLPRPVPVRLPQALTLIAVVHSKADAAPRHAHAVDVEVEVVPLVGPQSTMISTTPLKIAWARIVGPIRRSRYAPTPSATPTADRTITRPMLPVPAPDRSGRNRRRRAWRTTVTTAPNRAAQAAHHDATEHHLLDERCCHDRGDRQRDDVGAVGVDVGDALGVAGQGDVEHEDERRDGDLHDQRRDPDDRTPAGIAPPEPQPNIGAQPPGPPAPADVPAPRDRRSVSHRRQQRDVHDAAATRSATARRSTTGRRPTTPTGLQVHRPQRRSGGTGAVRPGGGTDDCHRELGRRGPAMPVEVAKAGPAVRVRVPARWGRRRWWELVIGQGGSRSGGRRSVLGCAAPPSMPRPTLPRCGTTRSPTRSAASSSRSPATPRSTWRSSAPGSPALWTGLLPRGSRPDAADRRARTRDGRVRRQRTQRRVVLGAAAR